MKYAAYALITLGAAVFLGKIAGMLPFLQGGIVVVLVLGAPALGAFLWFVNRSLSRPAGIDNDDIYRKPMTAGGIIAIVAGVVLTGFYVMIYLGNDVSGDPRAATVSIDANGVMTDVSGPGAAALRYACWQCPNKNNEQWWQGAEATKLFPYNGGFKERVNAAVAANADAPPEAAAKSLTISSGYVYKLEAVRTNGDGSGAGPANAGAELRFTARDSLHHWAGRNIYRHFDPLAKLIRGKAADNWFFYGTLYTLGVLVFGVRMLLKYRHSNYHILRTVSVMFVQLGFGYLIPNFLVLLDQPEFYFSYFWPLKYEYLWPSTWLSFAANEPGVYFILFGAAMSFVGVPVLTFFYGKRWYCSWVCGCGGLAETVGDPYRQLSDKSLGAWQLERWIIHSVLVAVVAVTALLWANSFTGGGVLGSWSGAVAKAYGFYIGAIFSGVVGVGFYPILGNRVWCRFGCPLAAILGIFQKFASRFRITTNGGQCISCGNCSTYCEMGIDVRWYAQRGQNIIRASCVGCGVCAAVCPRGVLRLENGKMDTIFNRYNDPRSTVLLEA